ncbi:MAG: molecular chaperone TorD family protein [Chloroflexi bacterium]|nr:molecular chaperone TorD family protein [Chloroflexota bacterium]
MESNQLALAHSRTYTLFSGLYLNGLTGELLPIIQAVPELAAALPNPLNPDQAAADHQHLFGFNVFPYASLFLDPTGLLGGPVVEAVQEAYRAASFAAPATGESADHVGHELGLLAFLAAAEARAWEEDRPAAAAQWQTRQRRFLDHHLLPWLPPLVVAIRQQGHPFYTALVTLTLELVHAHRAGLGETAALTFSLPPAPNLLDEPATGLKEIAAYLLSPPTSGLYLGRDDLGRLARHLDLPAGFGDRRPMLLALFHSAASHDRLAALLQALQTLATEWERAYKEMELAGAWQARAAQTHQFLADLQGQILSKSL